MNDEIELAEKVELQDAERLETIRQTQAQVWREQFVTNTNNPKNIERTIQAMGDYMEQRYKQLDALENKEQGMINKLQDTMVNFDA